MNTQLIHFQVIFNGGNRRNGLGTHMTRLISINANAVGPSKHIKFQVPLGNTDLCLAFISNSSQIKLLSEIVRGRFSDAEFI